MSISFAVGITMCLWYLCWKVKIETCISHMLMEPKGKYLLGLLNLLDVHHGLVENKNKQKTTTPSVYRVLECDSYMTVNTRPFKVWQLRTYKKFIACMDRSDREFSLADPWSCLCLIIFYLFFGSYLIILFNVVMFNFFQKIQLFFGSDLIIFFIYVYFLSKKKNWIVEIVMFNLSCCCIFWFNGSFFFNFQYMVQII